MKSDLLLSKFSEHSLYGYLSRVFQVLIKLTLIIHFLCIKSYNKLVMYKIKRSTVKIFLRALMFYTRNSLERESKKVPERDALLQSFKF